MMDRHALNASVYHASHSLGGMYLKSDQFAVDQAVCAFVSIRKGVACQAEQTENDPQN